MSFTEPESIPEEMRAFDSWLVATRYKEADGKIVKKPVYPSSSFHDFTDWDSALGQFSERRSAGLGFNLDGHDVLCLDYDYVMADGEFLSKKAEEIFEYIDGWAEYSTSRTGCHQFLIAPDGMLDGYERRLYFDDVSAEHIEEGSEPHVEVMDGSGFVFLTGAEMDRSHDSLPNRQDRLDDVVRGVFPESTSTTNVPSRCTADTSQTSADVQTIYRTISEWSKSDCALGESAEKALDAWHSASGEGRSEEDYSFISQLLFFCKGDEQLVYDCYEASDRSWQRHRGKRYEEFGGDWLEYSISRCSEERTGGHFEGRYVS